MADNVRRTAKQIPVYVGDGKYVLASADIFRTPDKVLIQIIAPKADEGEYLAAFLERAEPIGLTFNPIPVRDVK